MGSVGRSARKLFDIPACRPYRRQFRFIFNYKAYVHRRYADRLATENAV